MISGTVNVTTGPVAITTEVSRAFTEPPISHRSAAFDQLFRKTTELLCCHFSVKHVFLLTGSGTLANEAMLHEIKYSGTNGLILSNGEFGSRLIEQAERNTLDFISYRNPWGEAFDMTVIEKLIIEYSPKWILFCHCETSTGCIIDLDRITALAKKHNCLCFVDCMSTVGTMRLDLSKVAMATASSGKGLASVPGLAIVFSNIEPKEKKSSPVYTDLHHYASNKGIPFTISSNLLKALYVSIRQKLVSKQFDLLADYGQRISALLNENSLIPFYTAGSSVFTITPSASLYQKMIHDFQQHRLLLSYQSNYLKIRHWCQLALFGYYRDAELQYFVDILAQIIYLPAPATAGDNERLVC